MSASEAGGAHLWKAFKEGMHDLGWIEAKSIEYRVVRQWRCGALGGSCRRTDRPKVAVIVVGSGQSAGAAHRAKKVRDNVVAGGLLGYGYDAAGNYGNAAKYADKILRGVKPADLPIEQATKLELVINLKPAKRLGLTIPQSALSRADEAIQ